MNYYQHHIGDFDRATRHLTRMERSIYRDLIELYYDTEQPLTLDRAALCRKIIANSNEEATAVEQTLNEFFTETATGWYHNRCEAEIGRYHNSTSQKAVAGKASALKRAAKKQEALNGNPTDDEQALNGNPTNQEPITNNHKPVTNTKPKTAPALPLPDWLPADSWVDYLETRKVMKSPMTDRAKLLAIGKLSELRQSGHDPTAVLNQSIYNGWKGLFPIKADTVTTHKGQTRHEQLADKLADLTGANRRNKPGPEGVINGYAERVD